MYTILTEMFFARWWSVGLWVQFYRPLAAGRKGLQSHYLHIAHCSWRSCWGSPQRSAGDVCYLLDGVQWTVQYITSSSRFPLSLSVTPLPQQTIVWHRRQATQCNRKCGEWASWSGRNSVSSRWTLLWPFLWLLLYLRTSPVNWLYEHPGTWMSPPSQCPRPGCSPEITPSSFASSVLSGRWFCSQHSTHLRRSLLSSRSTSSDMRLAMAESS